MEANEAAPGRRSLGFLPPLPPRGDCGPPELTSNHTSEPCFHQSQEAPPAPPPVAPVEFQDGVSPAGSPASPAPRALWDYSRAGALSPGLAPHPLPVTPFPLPLPKNSQLWLLGREMTPVPSEPASSRPPRAPSHPQPHPPPPGQRLHLRHHSRHTGLAHPPGTSSPSRLHLSAPGTSPSQGGATII